MNEKPVVVKLFNMLIGIFNQRKNSARTLKRLIIPLIESEVFPDKEAALKAIIIDFIERKIESYDKISIHLQQKYGKDFYEFSKDLNMNSTEEIENDWMDWKLAIEMKNSYQNAYTDSINE